MKKLINRIDWEVVFTVFILVLVLGFVAFYIYIWIAYGNKPADEIPVWVWWLMMGSKG